MSESRANLEQILELLLAEENEQAEELLHEYVVAKARQQYERVLDESEEVEEDLDESEELEESEEVDESSCGSKKKHNEEEELDEEVEETIDHSDPSADYVEDVTAIQDAVEADEFGYPMIRPLTEKLYSVDVVEAFSPPRVSLEAKQFGLKPGEDWDLCLF